MDHVEANGIRFAYLEQGEGPLVLLFHGFPDTMPGGHFLHREHPEPFAELLLKHL